MDLSTRAVGKSLKTLREVLKHPRHELGLLQPHIARAIGLKSADFISLVESGQRSMDLNRIPALARVLKLNAKDLVLMAIREQWPEAAIILTSGRTSRGKEETIWAPAGVLRCWIERYGVPRALYTDWKNVYVRPPNAQERMRGEAAVTQFGRICAKLGICIIAASSPQAKGRVEWAHGTHQDRLVKKLRLAGIVNYEQANAYLDEHYLAEHNRRYARPAAEPADYHRHVRRRGNWTKCFGWRRNEW